MNLIFYKNFLHKHLNKKKKLMLSAMWITSAAFILCSEPVVHAATLDDLTTAMEARKALTIESNQIENWPAGPAVGAESAIVMDANSGAILYSKNIHEKLYPASTTKLLTCLVASEKASLDEMVSFSKNAVFSIEPGSSNMGMDVGQSITMEECLYGILVGSANEVSNAVAEHISGTIEDYAKLMNEKAAELGCADSNFVNANGLQNESHYTSAYDLATIARAFYRNELLAKISGTPSYHFEPTATQPDDFILRTHHKIVTNEYPLEGIIGGKTGFTATARQTLVTCAERNGMKLICVVMKDESPYQFTDTVDLLNYAFSSFEKISIVQNETKYRIDNSDFFHTNNDVFGNSTPILSINKDSYIVLPNTTDFSDTESVITYETDTENQLAKIDYTYHGVYVGSAAIDITSNATTSYDFNSPAADSSKQSENTSDNTIFINIKRILLFILCIAGGLILLVFLKSILQNYSFAKKRRRRLRRKQRRHERMRSQFRDFDL